MHVPSSMISLSHPGATRRSASGLSVAIPLVAIALMASCHGAPRSLPDVPNALNLASSVLRDGNVPASLTCDGVNTSPNLTWSAPPANTRSFALILADPDAPQGTFVHWVLYNLSASARSLPAAFPARSQFADGSLQGNNDFGNFGYGGPCPPGHKEHRYVFDLYALDTTLDLPSGATGGEVEAAMKGHILARGRLIARYSHQSLSHLISSKSALFRASSVLELPFLW